MDIRQRNERSLTLLVTACLAFLATPAAGQSGTPALLSPEVAFHLEASRPEPSRLQLSWTIAPGYYLYRHGFRFQAPDGEPLDGIVLPRGETKHDPYFGLSEIYRGRLVIEVPLGPGPDRAPALTVISQGCADIGVCFPPQRQRLNLSGGTELEVPAAAGPASSPATGLAKDPLAALTGAGTVDTAAPQFLSVDEAFPLVLELVESREISVFWRIANGHYLYRHGFRFELAADGRARPLEVSLPAGEAENDPYFGPVETYRGDLRVRLPIKAGVLEGVDVVSVGYQGCADAGLCYPPALRSFRIDHGAGRIVEHSAAGAAALVDAPGPAAEDGALPFIRVLNVPALDAALAHADRSGAPVMLEFYADWCVPCREMEARSFPDARVQAALSGVVLLRADVTRGSAEDRDLLRRFDLHGPPAILFFGRGGEELGGHRVVGFTGPEDFAARIERALR